MRKVFLLAAFVALAVTTGCEWLDRMKDSAKTDGKGPVKPVDAKSAPELVGYLNRQSNYVNSVRYSDANIEVYVGKDKERWTLNDSTLVCAKPRNFLLVGGRHLMANVVNIGSNSQEFWMYSKFPEQAFIVCAHADFPNAGDKLPFPFDPDWALQALGMTEYPTNLNYAAEANEKQGEIWLSFDTTTPQGVPVKRVVVFAAAEAKGTQPQIRRHLILDAAGKLIAAAEVREVSRVQIGTDPQTRQPVFAQVPTRVALDWPQQQFKMELKLGKPKVNERMSETDTAKLFARPTFDGVKPVNLAQVKFDPSNYRGAAPK